MTEVNSAFYELLIVFIIYGELMFLSFRTIFIVS